ncbi:two-component system response regulator [Roseospira marina]|nr:EAL domain-containing protein [Roseospira marina]MBB4314351.1 diguanylate cyclase (GGDEF)-like protein/PAS domain S-box-containing protein [Roseospira marina]MBB5087511.1 diguanylate cyclase (GGDEF)-like protein/PAS domain S-box-containing protein [Roseospira marina]
MRDPTSKRTLGHPLILVVDDDPVSLRTLLEALRQDYDITVATNAEDAWGVLNTQDIPDLILLDILMPGTDGFSFCEKIKRTERTQDIPVVFMTALTDEASEARGFSAGAVDYIHKPFKIPLVRARVRTHMTTRGLMDALLADNQILCEQIDDLEKISGPFSPEQGPSHAPHKHHTLIEELLDKTSEGVIVCDPSGRIVRINPAFTRISGYRMAEAVGRNVVDLKFTAGYAGSGADVWVRLTETGSWHGELRSRRKNGESYPEYLSATAIRNAAGITTHYVIMFEDASAALRTQEKIDKLTWYDALTGLPNRLLYFDRLELTLRYCQTAGYYSAVIALDVDAFRAINESQGLAVGDLVLKEIAKRVATELGDDGTVARLAGDEYAIVLTPTARSRPEAAEQALVMTERLQTALAVTFAVNAFNVSLSCSYGISIFPKNGRDAADTILQRAHTARHRATGHSGNSVVFFDESMGRQAQEKFALIHDMKGAMEAGQFALVLQTQVSQTDTIVGAEALLRWNHPKFGMVPPDTFVPIAEETGLIVNMDRWVLDQAIAIIRRAEAQNKRLRISVNISPFHFAVPSFVTHIRQAVAAAGIRPEHLVLEVTEGLILHDVHSVIETMRRLGDFGIRFSLDDFGSGYSSLSHLKRLPIHEVKIDKGLVLDAPRDENDARIIDVILGIGAILGIEVVAEGVETEEHVRLLRKHRNVILQGYHFGRPEPVEQWLEANLDRLQERPRSGGASSPCTASPPGLGRM